MEHQGWEERTTTFRNIWIIRIIICWNLIGIYFQNVNKINVYVCFVICSTWQIIFSISAIIKPFITFKHKSLIHSNKKKMLVKWGKLAADIKLHTIIAGN